VGRSRSGGAPTQRTQPGKPAGEHGFPTWSPDGKTIAFTAREGATIREIWSVPSDGGQPEVVSANDAQNPVYAPDGRALYFSQREGASSSFKLMRVPLSSSGRPTAAPELLKDTGQVPYATLGVSADGRLLIYSAGSVESNLWSLHLAPKTAEAIGPPESLTHDTRRRKTYPLFSPDGSKISYAVQQVGERWDIWLIDPDGRSDHALNADPGGDGAALGWLPDGKSLTFTVPEGDRLRLVEQEIDSGKRTLLRDFAPRTASTLRCSPDGKQVAFQSTRDGATNVWTAPVEGGVPRQVTFDKESASFPSWSPDGKLLGVEINRVSDTYIAVVPSGGGTPIQLTFEPGQSWLYGWSPDGDKIAFAGLRNDIWNLYWVSRSTHAVKQLTNYTKPSTWVRYPAWSPRNDQIVYEYTAYTGNIWMMRLK